MRIGKNSTSFIIAVITGPASQKSVVEGEPDGGFDFRELVLERFCQRGIGIYTLRFTIVFDDPANFFSAFQAAVEMVFLVHKGQNDSGSC